MKMRPFSPAVYLPLLLLLLSASCSKEGRNETQDPASATAVAEKKLESALLKSVRAATSKYNSTNEAILAGYQPDNHCVSAPGLGGMGYHWVNPSLVDPVFDPLTPEVMLYAKGPGGNLRLVAVEYIVINTGQAAPMLGDQPFMTGGTPVPVPHWSLHVWLHENNPAGMFTPFNPNITCP